MSDQKGTIIELTEEQKEQMRRATGTEHEAIKVENVGRLAPRITPGRSRLTMKASLKGKSLTKAVAPKRLAKGVAPKRLAKSVAPKRLAKAVAPKRLAKAAAPKRLAKAVAPRRALKQ